MEAPIAALIPLLAIAFWIFMVVMFVRLVRAVEGIRDHLRGVDSTGGDRSVQPPPPPGL